MAISESLSRLSAAAGRLIGRVTSIITFVDGFLDTVQKIAKHSLTQADNETFCPWRLGALLALLSLIGQSIWMLHAGGSSWSPTQFGMGCAAILGAGAAGSKYNDTSAPAEAPPSGGGQDAGQ